MNEFSPQMLVVAQNEIMDAVEITCDEEGLSTLISTLETLRKYGNHLHLRTPTRGGKELNETDPYGRPVYKELTINAIVDIADQPA